MSENGANNALLPANSERRVTSLILDMNKVDEADARRLKKALLALSGANAPETLLGNGFVEPTPWNPPELEEQP